MEKRQGITLVKEVTDLGYRIRPKGNGYEVTCQGVSLHPHADTVSRSDLALQLLLSHLNTQADS